MATGFHLDLLPTNLIEGGKAELTEITQNFYFRVIDKFNKMYEYKPIEVNKAGLLELLGVDIHEGYNSKQIKAILDNICRPLYFEHKRDRLAGSVFNVWLQEDKDLYTIYFNDPFRGMLFTRKDVDILDKNKKKEKLSVPELDYWDTILKDKKTKLRLLTEAEYLGLTGKYAKLIYCYIKAFGNKKIIQIKFDDFKKALNIPASYRIADIDRQIIKPCIEEFAKFGYKIEIIKKKTEGQGNKTTHIDILVAYRKKNPSDAKPADTSDASTDTEEVKGKDFELSVEEEAEAINILVTKEKFTADFIADMKKKNMSMYRRTLKGALSGK